MKTNKKALSLKEIQKIELDILIAFSDFCKNNNLRYYLAYGTLLGAVRHKGFIPWDDDIDVYMPRADYDRFIQMTGFNPISSKYETRLYKNCMHPNIYPYAKLIDIETIVYEKGKSKKNISGLWIDIFPLDGYPDSDLSKAKIIFNKYKKMRNLQDLCTTNPFYVKQSLVKKIIKFILLPLFRLHSVKKLCSAIEDNAMQFDYNTCEYVGDLIWGDNYNILLKKSELEPAVLVQFEGHSFFAPNCFENYLKLLYGDYTKLPGENQRLSHGFLAYKLK